MITSMTRVNIAGKYRVGLCDGPVTVDDMTTSRRQADHITTSLPRIVLPIIVVLLTTILPMAAVDDKAFEAWKKHLNRELTFLTGRFSLGSQAALELPNDMTFLASKDAVHVNRHFFGNYADPDTTLGMLLPIEMKERYEAPEQSTGAQADPARDWAVIITWVPGHLPVDQKVATDPDLLMTVILEADRRTGAQRPATAMSSLKLSGWAEPPTYDAEQHHLTWPLLIRESLHTRIARNPAMRRNQEKSAPTSQDILNYQVRMLGAAGIIQLVAVSAAEQLDEIADVSQRVVKNIAWTPGAEYTAYTPGTHPYYRQGIPGMLAGLIEGDPRAGSPTSAPVTGSGPGIPMRYLVPLLIGGIALLIFGYRMIGVILFAVANSNTKPPVYRPLTTDHRACPKCQSPININAARCPACGASARS